MGRAEHVFKRWRGDRLDLLIKRRLDACEGGYRSAAGRGAAERKVAGSNPSPCLPVDGSICSMNERVVMTAGDSTTPLNWANSHRCS